MLARWNPGGYAPRPSDDERRTRWDQMVCGIVETMVDGVVTLDRDDTVSFANPAAARLLGLPVHRLEGEPFPFPQQPGAISEVRADHRNGDSLTLELRTSEMSVDGEPVRVVSIRDVTEVVRLRRNLEDLARTDELTGLFNRRGFLALCERHLRLADRHASGVLVLFVDLDGLKRINDTHGHAAGDEAIVRVAIALKSTVRGTDVVGRVGGDEFAVAALDVPEADVPAVRGRVARILHALGGGPGSDYDVQVSLGAARYEPGSGRTVASLLAAADDDMYRHKRARSGGA